MSGRPLGGGKGGAGGLCLPTSGILSSNSQHTLKESLHGMFVQRSDPCPYCPLPTTYQACPTADMRTFSCNVHLWPHRRWSRTSYRGGLAFTHLVTRSPFSAQPVQSLALPQELLSPRLPSPLCLSASSFLLFSPGPWYRMSVALCS